MSLKIKPLCLNGRQVAFLNKGFFVPCCWVDGKRTKPFKELGFFNDEFHISNLKTKEDIEAVFESEIWQNFYEKLLSEPNDSPFICKDLCGYINDKKSFHEKRINITQI